MKKGFILVIFSVFVALGIAQTTNYTYTTSQHNKEVIGYFTQWDAWKSTTAGVTKGFYNQLNLDYSQYTILNWSFFGVANDGSLHSGDYRNKSIYLEGEVQEPADLFDTDVYSSWDLWLLYGDLDLLYYLPENLEEDTDNYLYWVYETYGYTGTSDGGWKNTKTGETGNFTNPLALHNPDEDGEGVLALAHKNDVKLVASIGGWSMCKHFPEVAADADKRAAFVADCKTLIDVYGFDGIDIDWEYPGPFSGMNFTGSDADYDNFLTLMKEIREAIGDDKLLTAAFSSDPNKLAGFDWTSLGKVMDYFNMMTYDMNGGWSDYAGHNSPLYSYNDKENNNWSWNNTFEYMTSRGIDPQKINMGVAFYGRGVICAEDGALNAATEKTAMTIQPDGPIESAADYDNWEVFDGAPNYNFILDNDDDWTYHWDSTAQVPYLTKGKYFLSYDNEESIEEKAKYVNTNNIGGVIVWQVFGDLDPGTITTTYSNKLPYAPSTTAPLVNILNRVFADGDTSTHVSNGNAPKITFISPEQNDTIWQDSLSEVEISLYITDSDNDLSSASFILNNETVIFSSEDSVYSHSYTPTSFGTQELTATAIDEKDNTTTTTLTFVLAEKENTGGNDTIITNTAPEISFITPTNNSYIRQDELSEVEITVKITDKDGEIAKTSFELNNENVVFTANDSIYSYSYTPSAFGKQTLNVMAVDNNSDSTAKTLIYTTKQTSTSSYLPITDYLSEEKWNEFFPFRAERSADDNGDPIDNGDTFYDYSNFIEAVKTMSDINIIFERRCGTNYYRVTRIDESTNDTTVIRDDDEFENSNNAIITTYEDYGNFLSEGSAETYLRELAAFLGNISQETTGGWTTAPRGRYSWGLYFKEEQGYEDTDNIGYQVESDLYPYVEGKSYHGRGPIQLSYNYNYGQCSEFLFGDKNVLLKNPEMVVEDGVVAFETAIWFWMTEQYPKPSCHDVMAKNFEPTDEQLEDGLIPGFGMTINIINGGVECYTCGDEFEKVKYRVGHYERYADSLNVSMALDGSSDTVQLGCAYMKHFSINSNECNDIVNIGFASPSNGDAFLISLGDEIDITLNINDPDSELSNIQITVDGKTFNDTIASWTPSDFGTYTLTATADYEGEEISSSIEITIYDEASTDVCITLDDWDESTTYSTKGNQVVYDNKIYENQWWTQGDEPSSTDVWKYIQDCGNSSSTNEAPIISNVSPTNGATITQDDFTSISLSATVTDEDDNLASVKFTVDGKELTTTVTGNIYSATFTPSAFNDYTFVISATDSADATTTSTTTFTIKDNTGTSNSAPVITNISPADGEEIEQASLTSISLSASVSDEDDNLSKVIFTIDGTAITTSVSNGVYSSTFTPSAFDDYTFVITATDSMDVTTTSTTTFTVKETGGSSTDETCGYDEWEAQVYSTAGSYVYYDGSIYTNQWYAESYNIPGENEVWKFVSNCGDGNNLTSTCGYVEWEESTTYATGGEDTVYHNGGIYVNKWWTKGDEPGDADVWKYILECSSTKSGTTAINKNTVEDNSNIDVYPNPVSGVLNIKSNDNITELQVFSINGKVLLSKFNSSQIDVSELASGMYFIKIENENGNVDTLRFIKK